MSRTRIALLVVLGLLLGFAVVEIGIRVYVGSQHGEGMVAAPPVEMGRWVPHPFLPYAGRPNAEYTFKNNREPFIEHVKTNAYGFRSHEFPAEKGPNDFFVVCLGGSTTFGYAASNDLTWPELLEKRLAERYPERNIKVFNLGQDNATSVVSLVNLLLIGVHVQPDLVIVYHGYNDLDAVGASNFRTDHSHFYADLDPDKAWRGIERSLPAWMRRSYAITWMAGASDLVFRLNDLGSLVSKPREPDPDRLRGIEATLQNFRTMASAARGRGAEILFSTFQFRDGDGPLFVQFNDRLRAYFEERGFPYVDQAALIPDNDASIHVDECHFTQRGREMMADNYFDAIVARGFVD